MGLDSPLADSRRTESTTAVVRDLAGIRRQVSDLSGMMAADRPCPELLCRISAIRAALRGTRRRVLLHHVRRSIEETLPGDGHVRTRRELTELLSAYPSGVLLQPSTREPSTSRNEREEPS